MLSDEEREALERIDYIQNFIIENGQYNADVNDMQYFSKVLNIIEKQQKEMEELKEERKKYPIAMNDEQYKKVIELAQKDIKEELDRQINVRMINEEYIEKNYISKDKIKATIEELQEDIKYSANPLSIDNSKFGIKILQSLLEE